MLALWSRRQNATNLRRPIAGRVVNNVRSLWRLLIPSEKRGAVGLFVLMVISMLLEMLSVGLVVPALAAMNSERPVELPAALSPWLSRLGDPSQTQLLLAGLVLLVVLYVFKSIFLLYANWQQLRFVAGISDRLSRSLYGLYLSQPWSFHLQRNSAELVRAFEDVQAVSTLTGLALSTLAELLIAAGILALLVWFEPVGAIAVGVMLGVATWILDRITRKRLEQWGHLVRKHDVLARKHLVQGMNGAKDVKILGRESEFTEQFVKHRARYVAMNIRQAFVGAIPRLWYELLAVFALCSLTVVMVWQGFTTRQMIPLLGLFAAAAFRLLPSVNRLSHAVQMLRFGHTAMRTLEAELALPPPPPTAASGSLTLTREIQLRDVCFRYSGSHTDAVHGVSLRIPRGASVGIIGGSGAGKSTLVDIILGLLTPTAGEVTVDGIDVAANIRSWQTQIGYVPQSIYLCDDTIRRNIAFGLPDEAIDNAAVARALRAAQLDDFVNHLPQGVETIVGEHGVRLSGGQRQRIGIARALYHDPAVLVLDEATSALDGQTERDFVADVETMHGVKTMIIVAHRLTTVARCDVLYRLEGGRVVASGTFAELTSTL